jgi:hypothetical protein
MFCWPVKNSAPESELEAQNGELFPNVSMSYARRDKYSSQETSEMKKLHSSENLGAIHRDGGGDPGRMERGRERGWVGGEIGTARARVCVCVCVCLLCDDDDTG